MKKIYLLVFLLTLGKVHSQKLIATPEGLRDSLNVEKNYVVIEVKGKKAKQLYNLCVDFVNNKYKNSKEAMNSIPIDGEFFSYKTEIPVFQLTNNGKFIVKSLKQSIEYDTELSFKDGYIKYEIKKLHMYMRDVEVLFKGSSWTDTAIYNKSNKLIMKAAKDNLETHFFSMINEIKDYIKVNENKNKW
jgi:hypothetical protein